MIEGQHCRFSVSNYQTSNIAPTHGSHNCVITLWALRKLYFSKRFKNLFQKEVYFKSNCLFLNLLKIIRYYYVLKSICNSVIRVVVIIFESIRIQAKFATHSQFSCHIYYKCDSYTFFEQKLPVSIYCLIWWEIECIE